jgi:hypothetical protein
MKGNMKKQQFEIIEHNEYLEKLIKIVEDKRAKSVILTSMNFFARPGSLVERLARAMQTAKRAGEGKFEIRYDWKFFDREVMLPDGHYVLKFSFWDPQHWHKKFEPNRLKKRNLREFGDLLVDSPSRFLKIPTLGNWLQRLFSWHLCQFLSANHAKSGTVRLRDGTTLAILATGELVSDVKQDNLALVLKNNEKAIKFLDADTGSTAVLGTHGYVEEEIFPHASLIVDHGNYGEPGMLSRIHELAEMLVNPLHNPCGQGGEPPKFRPTNIVLITQYAPGGRFRRVLKKASLPPSKGGFGTRVVVPLEPKKDYRRHDPGFALLFHSFLKRKGKYIHTPVLKVPTHVKCLIVKYDDGKTSMIFGSDNFDSYSDLLYRNTEVAIHIDRVVKGDEGYTIIQSMLDKLVSLGEISASERKNF